MSIGGRSSDTLQEVHRRTGIGIRDGTVRAQVEVAIPLQQASCYSQRQTCFMTGGVGIGNGKRADIFDAKSRDSMLDVPGQEFLTANLASVDESDFHVVTDDARFVVLKKSDPRSWTTVWLDLKTRTRGEMSLKGTLLSAQADGGELLFAYCPDRTDMTASPMVKIINRSMKELGSFAVDDQVPPRIFWDVAHHALFSTVWQNERWLLDEHLMTRMAMRGYNYETGAVRDFTIGIP